MDLAALTVDAWRSASPAEKAARARALVLPRGLRFVGVEPVESFGRTGHAALFALRERRFALVPGGEVRLGYRPDRLALTDDDRESYAFSRDGFGLPPLSDYLTDVLTPARTVVLAPYLFEVEPVDWDDAFPDDAPRTHAEAAALLRRQGLRLPSSDEWEHALAGDAESVFLWGDALGRGHGESSRWLSSFGVRGPSGYLELTDDPHVLRGADTGPLHCAGIGRVVLGLAASPRRREPRADATHLHRGDTELRLRRVCPLASPPA